MPIRPRWDPTAVPADLHALRRLAAERVEFRLDERGVEHAPPLLDILNSIIAAQERAVRLRARTEEMVGVDIRVVDKLVANVIGVITEYVDPRDLPAAIDKLAALQAHCLRGTGAEAHLPSEQATPEVLEGAIATPRSRSASGRRPPDEGPIAFLPGDDGLERMTRLPLTDPHSTTAQRALRDNPAVVCPPPAGPIM